MIGRIIGLVFAYRDAVASRFRDGFEHALRRASFSRAIGLGPLADDREPVAVLHGYVAHIRKFRLASRSLAIKPTLRIGLARMGVVGALLPLKVRAASLIATVLGAKALLRGPCFDQGSVHRKVLVRQQRLHLRVVEKLDHELRKNIA